MEQNINIAALLKDCHKGTKLYSPLSGECELEEISNNAICMVFNNKEAGWDFDQYGFLIDDTDHLGECLLFPSKEVRDWGMFHAQYYIGKNAIGVLVEAGGIDTHEFTGGDDETPYYIDRITNHVEYASSVKEVGYLLDNGTELKLEEENPKFKVGDVIVAGSVHGMGVIVDNIKYDGYEVTLQDMAKEEALEFRLATPEEIVKWNKETLEPNHLHYSTSKRKIIHWFNTGDAVLVRNGDNGIWSYSHFSYYLQSITNKLYVVTNGVTFKQCIPYNALTMNLVGTNGKPPREFCNWENADESLSN